MPNPSPGKELFTDQVHSANVRSPTGNCAMLSWMYGMFVASSACTYCTWGGNNEQKDKDELAARAYGLLYLILLAKGSNHSLQEFVVRHSWTEFLQIRNW